MIRNRSDGQVVASAAQIDVARIGGLPDEQVAALVTARSAWRETGRLDRPVTDAFLDALASPAAFDWDGVFVTYARRHVGR